MHFVWRAIVVWLIVFAGCLLGAATQWILPADHLAQAKVAIGSMQGLVILLLALVLGLLVWTSYGVYSQQQTETQTLVSQILQLDLALDHHGPEAERGRDLLKNELIETRERFWGRDPHANLLTYAQTRAELRSMDRFFAGLTPTDDEQRHALDTARQLSASILETHYLMSRQLRNPLPAALIVIVVCWATFLFWCIGALSSLDALSLTVETLGAAAVASAIFLILEFSQPYRAFFGIKPHGIDQVISALSAKARQAG